MAVLISKLTRNLKNGDWVKFNIGEKVLYELSDGGVVEITINSEFSKHAVSGDFGYEAIFSDDGKEYFAISKQIIDWEDKC